MDEHTKRRLKGATIRYINNLIRIADEENCDRDRIVRTAAGAFAEIAETSTFKHFKLDD